MEDPSGSAVPINRPTPPPPPPIRRAEPSSASPVVESPAPVVAPAVSASGADEPEVAIRTMQDDLGDIKRGKNMQPLHTPTPTVPAPAPVNVLAPKATMPAAPAATPVFPLPPKTTGKPEKVVLAPAVARKRRRRWWVGVLLALFVLLLAGGGVAGWYFWQQGALTLPGFSEPAARVAPIAEVLPADSQVIIRYNLSQAEYRTKIIAAWAVQDEPGTAPAATLTSLLAGDPRLLATTAEITELYYVLLEDNSQPYVVVRVTPETTRLLGAEADVRSYEYAGWYIAHSLTIDPYRAARDRQSRAGNGDENIQETPQPSGDQPSTGAPMEITLTSSGMPALRQDIAGKHFLAGQLEELRLQADVVGSTLRLQGQAEVGAPLASGNVPAALVSLVPPQATWVRLGNNFQADLTTWLAGTAVIDPNVVRQPVVTTVLAQLTQPYALFAYPNADSTTALGMIIELPPALRGTIAVGDIAIEQALPALVPLVLDRRTVAPLSFGDATYQQTALRYANITGSSQALDYALTPTHLLIATSKDSMFALLDAATQSTTTQSAPPGVTATSWGAPLFTAWGTTAATLPPFQSFVSGSLRLPAIKQLLPIVPSAVHVPFALLFNSANGSTAEVTGIVDVSGSPAQ